MSDIVNELRKPWTDTAHSQELMQQAAQEIVELRFALDFAKTMLKACRETAPPPRKNLLRDRLVELKNPKKQPKYRVRS